MIMTTRKATNIRPIFHIFFFGLIVVFGPIGDSKLPLGVSVKANGAQDVVPPSPYESRRQEPADTTGYYVDKVMNADSFWLGLTCISDSHFL